MAVPKTLGIETEYGIVHRGVDSPNPISASSLLINAYLGNGAEDSMTKRQLADALRETIVA